jgi:hypothetical protein
MIVRVKRAHSFLLAAVLPLSASAQARVLSAPPEPSLLNITRQWSRASSLGDLRELRTGSGDIELRVWSGYTLTGGTQAVVLRRSSGRWSAFLARVMRCEAQIPRAIWDTASRATIARFTADARRHCTTLTDVPAGARILTTDTLLVAPLPIAESTIEEVWTAALHAGAFDLPPSVPRSRVVDDAVTYVVEARIGGDYRASMLERVEPDEPGESNADRQMQAIAAAVNRLLPPGAAAARPVCMCTPLHIERGFPPPARSS